MKPQTRKFYYTDSNSIRHEVEIDRTQVNRDCEGEITHVFVTAKNEVIELYAAKGNGGLFFLSSSGYVDLDRLTVQFSFDDHTCLKCGSAMEGELIRPDDEDEYTLWSCPECRDFEDF